MNVFLLELKNTWKGTLKWTVALGIFISLILAFYPTMKTESMKQLAGAKMEGLDPALLEALGLEEMADFTIITNYFGYMLPYLVLAIMMFVTQLAVNSLIKEETDGSIEFLYSKPISRNDILLHKTIATIVSFFVMLFVLYVITTVSYISYSDYNLLQSIKEVGVIYGAIFYVGVIFLAIGIFLSTLLKSSKGSSGVVMGIVFGTFFLRMMGVVIEDLSFLTYFSPIDWIKVQKLMTEGIKFEEWMIGSLIIVVCAVFAQKIYKRKDLRF